MTSCELFNSLENIEDGNRSGAQQINEHIVIDV